MYNKIMNNLYIGDYMDAIEFSDMWHNGKIICVLEHLPDHEPKKALHIPILEQRHDDGFDGIRASKEKLDMVVEEIHESLSKNQMVLVHCAAGMERSPLSVVWYLHKKHGLDINRAYDQVKAQRPQTIRREEWLRD